MREEVLLALQCALLLGLITAGSACATPQVGEIKPGAGFAISQGACGNIYTGSASAGVPFEFSTDNYKVTVTADGGAQVVFEPICPHVDKPVGNSPDAVDNPVGKEVQ